MLNHLKNQCKLVPEFVRQQLNSGVERSEGTSAGDSHSSASVSRGSDQHDSTMSKFLDFMSSKEQVSKDSQSDLNIFILMFLGLVSGGA